MTGPDEPRSLSRGARSPVLDLGMRVWARLPRLARVSVLRALNPQFMLGAVAFIQNERGEVLLLEHRFRPPWPWGLPGGFLRKNESLQEALVRELFEETRLRITPFPDPLDVEINQAGGYVSVALRVEKVEGSMELSSEILSARYVSPDAFPEGTYPYHRDLILKWTSSNPLRSTSERE